MTVSFSSCISPLNIILLFVEHSKSEEKKVLLSVEQELEAQKRLDKSDNEDNDAGTERNEANEL
jgi:heme exporter protein D